MASLAQVIKEAVLSGPKTVPQLQALALAAGIDKNELQIYAYCQVLASPSQGVLVRLPNKTYGKEGNPKPVPAPEPQGTLVVTITQANEDPIPKDKKPEPKPKKKPKKGTYTYEERVEWLTENLGPETPFTGPDGNFHMFLPDPSQSMEQVIATAKSRIDREPTKWSTTGCGDNRYIGFM